MGLRGSAQLRRQVRAAGCARAIVHARKAVLGGLSPKENRDIPPLRYDIVRELKRTFGDLPIIVNGGFATPAKCSRRSAGAMA